MNKKLLKKSLAFCVIAIFFGVALTSSIGIIHSKKVYRINYIMHPTMRRLKPLIIISTVFLISHFIKTWMMFHRMRILIE